MNSIFALRQSCANICKKKPNLKPKAAQRDTPSKKWRHLCEPPLQRLWVVWTIIVGRVRCSKYIYTSLASVDHKTIKMVSTYVGGSFIMWYSILIAQFMDWWRVAESPLFRSIRAILYKWVRSMLTQWIGFTVQRHLTKNISVIVHLFMLIEI